MADAMRLLTFPVTATTRTLLAIAVQFLAACGGGETRSDGPDESNRDAESMGSEACNSRLGTCTGGRAAEAGDAGRPPGVDMDGATNPQAGAGGAHSQDAGSDSITPPCDGGYAPSNGGSPCRIPDAPSSTGTIALVNAFEQLAFGQIVYMTYVPDGRNRLVVLDKGGPIVIFPNDPSVTSTSMFLDLRGVVSPGGSETGLFALAFDPDYPNNGYFYVSFTSGDLSTDDIVSHVVRYRVSDDNPDVADPDSATPILSVDQPSGFGNHKGGMIEFGPDGYLYLSLGDGGNDGNGQTTDDLLGAILRIDVRNPPNASPYGIPPDNPFADGVNGRPEIYAWGLRNPWRFSFDRLTSQLWVGDVGQGTWEEIDIVERGGNYGWNVQEGNHCNIPMSGCDTTGLQPPIAEYEHPVGECVTGGYVYRGTQVPSLYGAYVFGDYETRVLFALRPDQGGGVEQLAIQSPRLISSFGVDADGELYVIGFDWGVDGHIYRFEEQAEVPFPQDFPQTLAETGCFESLQPLLPARGLVPYTVNTPLWSDSADKIRYFVLPEGQQIDYDPSGRWVFPEGSIFVKNFYLETTRGDPGSRRIVETRFLRKQSDGMHGYSYRWNDEQSGAVLLESGSTRDFELRDSPQADPSDYVYDFPSRPQCRSCHTDVSGGLLGLETGQLNAELGYPPNCERGNQLDVLWQAGLLNEDPASGAIAFPALTDSAAPLEARARAYLHANCAHCHMPGGPSGNEMDLRYNTPVSNMRACDEDPLRGNLGVAGAKLIDPGSPDSSLVYLRMATRGEGRMPPLATSRVDEEAADVIRDWIASLSTCP